MTDRACDSERVARAAPRRNEGGVAARSAARDDEMDVVRTHPAMDPGRLVVRLDGAGDLAAALQIGPCAPRACVERLLDARLGPSVAREDCDVLGRQHHEGFARAEA